MPRPPADFKPRLRRAAWPLPVAGLRPGNPSARRHLRRRIFRSGRPWLPDPEYCI